MLATSFFFFIVLLVCSFPTIIFAFQDLWNVSSHTFFFLLVVLGAIFSVGHFRGCFLHFHLTVSSGAMMLPWRRDRHSTCWFT